MKQMLGFILFTLISSQSFAANECVEFKKAGDLFEAMKSTHEVVDSSEELTTFYRKSNNELKYFVDVTCDVNMDYSEIVNESNKMCNTACVKHSKITKENGKKFLKDCSNICEGARANQNAYKTKLMNIKKNADTAKATKESIADLKREAKELEQEFYSPPAKAQKSHKVNAK